MWPYGNDPVAFDILVGMSSKNADLDNIFKPLIDTIQALYEEFNDNKVYTIKARKEIVPKGEEFITVRIDRFTGNVHKREVTASEIPGLEEDEVS